MTDKPRVAPPSIEALACELDWALDIMAMYEGRLIQFGDPPGLVHSASQVARTQAARELVACAAAGVAAVSPSPDLPRVTKLYTVEDEALDNLASDLFREGAIKSHEQLAQWFRSVRDAAVPPEPTPPHEYPLCSWPDKPHTPRYEPKLGNTYCSKCGKWLQGGPPEPTPVGLKESPRPWRVVSTRNGEAWLLIGDDGEKIALANCTPNAEQNLRFIAATVNRELWAADSRAPAEVLAGVCENCHQAYGIWFAPNEIWNRVVPGRTGMLCPNCFINRATRSGIVCTGWELRPENYVSEEAHQSPASPPSEGQTAESEVGTKSQSPSPERSQDSSQTVAEVLEALKRDVLAEFVELRKHFKNYMLTLSLELVLSQLGVAMDKVNKRFDAAVKEPTK